MQIKVGDLVRHKYLPQYGIGLAIGGGDYWIQVKWVAANIIGARFQKADNLARVK